MSTLFQEFTQIVSALNERVKVNAVSQEELIFMKTISGRTQDLADIERMKNES